MKIGFVSDTHGDEYSLRRAIEYIDNYDAVIHTGDVLPYGVDYPCFISEYIKTVRDIYFVRGNTDYFDGIEIMNKDISNYDSIFTFSNLKIYATHGFCNHIAKYEEIATKSKCNILVHGHTHVKKLEKNENNLIILNPGSTSKPRDGVASFAILEDDIISLYDIEKLRVIKQMKIDI